MMMIRPSLAAYPLPNNNTADTANVLLPLLIQHAPNVDAADMMGPLYGPDTGSRGRCLVGARLDNPGGPKSIDPTI